jgi:hypothetical protein
VLGVLLIAASIASELGAFAWNAYRLPGSPHATLSYSTFCMYTTTPAQASPGPGIILYDMRGTRTWYPTLAVAGARCELRVPLLLPLLLTAAAWWLTRTKWPGVVSPCPHCGYSLAGNSTGACPECGTPVKT